METTVSVIICAYTEKRWDDLLKAVDSLKNQRSLPHEIIVVVDHNPSLLRRARSAIENIVVIENAETRGLSGARNSGIAVATGDILAFMDEDAQAAPDWIEQLLTPYTDPTVVGVGGAIEPNWDEGRPNWFPQEFDWVVGCTYRGMPTELTPVRNMIGCNMSFRRSIVDLVGGFRSGIGRVGTLPVGCEETEYCIRARALYPTGQFLFEPRARVYHRVPAERGRWQYFRSRCYFEGRSKALVTQMAGAAVGLSAERTYTTRVLPLGIMQGLSESVRKVNVVGLYRAFAIVAGLLTTVAGYGVGKVLQPRRVAAPTCYSAIGAAFDISTGE